VTTLLNEVEEVDFHGQNSISSASPF
jgi:hypothetical protein